MEATAEMTQFNARIEKALKERGDASLRAAGYTPSEAVRALWRKAAARAGHPGAIRELLEEDAQPGMARALDAKRAAIEACDTLYRDALAHLGISLDPASSAATLSYEELRDRTLLARYEGRVS